MSTINSALVSYEQVLGAPYSAPTTPSLSITRRYDNLERYAKTKEQDTESTGDTPTVEQFRWYYDGGTKPKASITVNSPTTMNGPTSSNPNNTPIIPKNDWVKQLSQAYRNLGVSENGIRNLIAKNALESNWGKSAQGRYNYGNITTGGSWKGDYVNGHDRDGNGNPIRNKFRSYNSLEEFAQDEVAFLKRLYDFNDNDDIDTFTYKLQGGNKGKRRYAEDPRYRNSVKGIYKGLG